MGSPACVNAMVFEIEVDEVESSSADVHAGAGVDTNFVDHALQFSTIALDGELGAVIYV